MQTFLPYPDFAQSARCLDRMRLGKQRVEVLQLLNALLKGGGWQNHPAAKMWRGYEKSLTHYGMVICEEWINRGYKDTVLDSLMNKWANLYPQQNIAPAWLGNPEFHASHRSNLLRKDPAWYGQFGWTEPHDLPYIWPVG